MDDYVNEIAFSDNGEKILSYSKNNSNNRLYMVICNNSKKILKLYPSKKKWLGEEWGNSIAKNCDEILEPQLLMSGVRHNVPYHVFSFIDGKKPTMIEINDLNFVKKLGEILSSFHVQERYAYFGIIPYKIFKTSELYLRNEVIKFFCEKNIPNIEKEKIRTLLKRNIALWKACNVKYGVPTHRDYTTQNILISPDNKIGLFDYEHTESGLPEFDFAKIFAIDFEFKIEICQAFLEGYKRIPNNYVFCIDRIRLVFMIQGIAYLRCGYLTDDPFYLKYGNKILDFVDTSIFTDVFKMMEE